MDESLFMNLKPRETSDRPGYLFVFGKEKRLQAAGAIGSPF
ncbi:hypothetical protein SAMN05421760_11269 [Neptunomonas antarctica]|uniref:Uncharacterized protein n=1 Tax=Neptunomonas antarctica TaxID=619304 RepID=A0A1N7P2P1_9GAMM|nr:hypothetical protein SAMN05421760_11269 [Neptunomonas antarctica]